MITDINAITPEYMKYRIEEETEQQKEEIERLKELCDKYEEEHKTTFEEWKKTINIINELEEWLKYKKEALEEFDLCKRKETGAFWYTTTGEIEGLLIKLQELKGSDKE